jgi:hypothetical protein
LLVLAKGPLHLGPEQVRSLAVWPTFVVVLGGFLAAAMSDRINRMLEKLETLLTSISMPQRKAISGLPAGRKPLKFGAYSPLSIRI